MADGRNWRKQAHIDGHRPDVHNRPIDETVADELRNAIELLAEDLVKEGWEPEAARREAEQRFGDPARVGRRSRRIFLRQGLKLTLKGGIAGFFLLFVGASIVSSLIYGISPLQVLVLLAGIAFLGVVVVAAMAVPALRATRVDPVEALRAE